jgi:hypothetical protein
VQNPKKAAFNVKDYHHATIELVQEAVRKAIEKLILAETLKFKAAPGIIKEIKSSMDTKLTHWGLVILRIKLGKF